MGHQRPSWPRRQVHFVRYAPDSVAKLLL